MASPTRDMVRRAQERLEEWTLDGRDRAYEAFFEGADAALRDEELRLLDRIDSDLTRRGEPGLWGTDEYGIAAGDNVGGPQVVCTYHPEIPAEGYRGAGSLDEATREELNDLLWDYCERVAALVEADLDAFLGESRGDDR